MSKIKSGKKVNKKVSEDVGRRRPRESNRERRIRQIAEANLEEVRRRLDELLHLNTRCLDYLEVSDYKEKLHDAEVVIGDSWVKASEFQRLVDSLVEEVLVIETSIASDDNIKDELLDERLKSMRQLLHVQPQLPLPCQIFLDFRQANLKVCSHKWDTSMTNLERKRFPDGRPIKYENGCVLAVKNHLEQALKETVILT